MSKEARSKRKPDPSAPFTAKEQLRTGREIMRMEAIALWKLSDRLNEAFCQALELLERCQGRVIVTGMGKAGLIGQKIAATLASTGTPAHFLHPAEAFHGDLGRIHHDDAVILLTQSGETPEVVQLLPSLQDFGVPLIAVTAGRENTVGRVADVVLALGQLEEACSLGLAPSTSTTAMLALGDALALVLSKMRGFRAEDFARFHPGGSLGRKLSKVDELMRPLEQCRVALESQTVREVIVACTKPGRRTGAIMLTDAEGRLTGLFTDSDLARLFERRGEPALDQPIREIMAANPTTVLTGTRVGEAVTLLAKRKFSELPVVNRDGRPLGLVDVTDVIGIRVESEANAPSKRRPKEVRVFPDDAAA